MSTTNKPATIGQLRESGYRTLPLKEEMRQNLIRKMRAGEELFPGIVGYEDTVIPQVENAILSGQDIVLLGERGQAKTRIARSLVNLLDDETPVIVGCEVAEGRYLSDELTIHYGIIPRTNRGIFCINELPDLAERIQVGLLNIMEERDVQIRGYKVRLPLDVFVVASANPEDYTNRGRIITPLKDRLGSEIRTHYPRTIEHEIAIMEAESNGFVAEGIETVYPQYMREIVAEITHQARRSSDVSQRSGVSVRVSITNYENVMSNAVRRAIRLKERQAVPRVSDLSAVIASTSGKIELDTVGEVREEKVVEKLIRQAILSVFRDYFEVAEFEQLVAGFDHGLNVQVSNDQPSMEYVNQLARVGGLRVAVTKLNGHGSPATIASAVEFILEGLHLNKRLNKDEAVGGVTRYRRS